jgi:hypothetical protein
MWAGCHSPINTNKNELKLKNPALEMNFFTRADTA